MASLIHWGKIFMFHSRLCNFALAASTLAIIMAAAPLSAQSVSYTTPHTTTTTGAQTVQLGGVTFSNQGPVGVGRLAASTRDFAGETLGSFSGMALDLNSWHRNADGSYSGSMWTLPDRGPNDVGPFVGTTNYRNRVHRSILTLTPYTGTAVLPQSTASQNQLAITPDGGFFLTDTTGANFTGKDGGSNVITRGGILYPSPASGEGAGRISLDSEAITYAPDGSFYVSDEYAAGIYHFDASGKQIGAIQTVAALLPRVNGVVNFDGANTPATGRRNNQGLESLAVTPDGSRLVTILQSATVQDTNGSNQDTRNNSRILVYDISTDATPANPIGHYVLQLPTFTQNGNGAAVNRTAAQSEMLALNSSQFLVLSRDGIGRGSGASATNSPVFKSILLVDTTGATNLAGTTFETGTTPIATNGTLASTIKPVQQVELVNMLNPVQLNRFGMNLNTAPSNATSLSEKWEAMGLAPVLDEKAPQDFFLFVGNDNDFITANGFINGQSFNAGLTGTGGTGDNDSVVLVYRLTLPTYVDPMALKAMTVEAPAVALATRGIAAEIGSAAIQPSLDALAGLRRTSDGDFGSGVRLWLNGGWSRINTVALGARDLKADAQGLTGGFDVGVGTGRIGATFAYRDASGTFGGGSSIEGGATSFGLYAGFAWPNGLYVEGAASRTLTLSFGEITRPAAYGQTARSEAKGSVWAAGGEIGWMVPLGRIAVGPFGTIDYADVDIHGIDEAGASLSNARYAPLGYKRLRYGGGIELRADLSQAVRPNIRVSYAGEHESGDKSITASLISAQHSMATQTIALPSTERERLVVGGGIDGSMGHWSYRFAAEGRFARGEDEARVGITVSTRL